MTTAVRILGVFAGAAVVGGLLSLSFFRDPQIPADANRLSAPKPRAAAIEGIVVDAQAPAGGREQEQPFAGTQVSAGAPGRSVEDAYPANAPQQTSSSRGDASDAPAGPTAPPVDGRAPMASAQEPPPSAPNHSVALMPAVLPAEISVPTGAKVPAVFLDDRPLPAPQRGFLDRIADEFIETVSQDGGGREEEVWEAARDAADREYIKLYGFEEFDALHRSAAMDALRERRAAAEAAPGSR